MPSPWATAVDTHMVSPNTSGWWYCVNTLALYYVHVHKPCYRTWHLKHGKRIWNYKFWQTHDSWKVSWYTRHSSWNVPHTSINHSPAHYPALEISRARVWIRSAKAIHIELIHTCSLETLTIFLKSILHTNPASICETVKYYFTPNKM